MGIKAKWCKLKKARWKNLFSSTSMLPDDRSANEDIDDVSNWTDSEVLLVSDNSSSPYEKCPNHPFSEHILTSRTLTESSISNLEIYLFKLWNLRQRERKEEKKGKRERTEKSQQINCHDLNVASSFKAKVLSLNNSPAWCDRQSHRRWCSVPVHSSAGTPTRWGGVSSSVRSFADGTAALFLAGWDSSHALQRFSQSTPPCMKNAHNWHNLPHPPRATQWRSKYRGKKKALKTLFLLFVQ